VLKHLTEKVTAVVSFARVRKLWSTTKCPTHCKDQQS